LDLGEKYAVSFGQKEEKEKRRKEKEVDGRLNSCPKETT
tara:strand:+ start:748 stop:864 length:117 start_codon:yes stop_codon:yes gene_type:complete